MLWSSNEQAGRGLALQKFDQTLTRLFEMQHFMPQMEDRLVDPGCCTFILNSYLNYI